MLRQEEPYCTPAQALAWAWERKLEGRTWPRRRFRVEGAFGGQSRLLMRGGAERTRSKYGGHVVELIPLPPTPAEVRAYIEAQAAARVAASKPRPRGAKRTKGKG